MCSSTISLRTFQTVVSIGRGAFGSVILTRKLTGSDRGIFYAIKKVPKDKIRGKVLQLTLRERNALVLLRDCPFVCKIHYAFQDTEAFYFGMEYLEGGTLAEQIKRRRFTEHEVRFYSSEIAIALQSVHAMGFVHRDLKPANIMLDRRGHIKLGDFGISKKLNTGGRTFSFCGTPNYNAPEVLRKSGHGFEVDWWALGVIIYEMLMGKGPFDKHLGDGPGVDKIYWNILHERVIVPTCFSAAVRDLIHKLLEQDPDRRLTDNQVNRHPFFNAIDWVAVANSSYMPVIIPTIDANLMLKVMLSPMPIYYDYNNSHQENIVSEAYIEGFDYVAPFV